MITERYYIYKVSNFKEFIESYKMKMKAHFNLISCSPCEYEIADGKMIPLNHMVIFENTNYEFKDIS